MNKNERINKAVMGCEGDDYHDLMRASVTSSLRKQAGFIPDSAPVGDDTLSSYDILSRSSGGMKWFEIIYKVRKEIGLSISLDGDSFDFEKDRRRLFMMMRRERK